MKKKGKPGVRGGTLDEREDKMKGLCGEGEGDGREGEGTRKEGRKER